MGRNEPCPAPFSPVSRPLSARTSSALLSAFIHVLFIAQPVCLCVLTLPFPQRVSSGLSVFSRVLFTSVALRPTSDSCLMFVST